MLSAIIVEDEVLAAERLRILLQEHDVTVLAQFQEAMSALEWLSQHDVDVAFVDIGLPEIDGIAFVERLKRTAHFVPAIIFTTAYEEHALKAFELAATDYLLKPIKRSRLQEAIQRLQPEHQEEQNFNSFAVQTRDRIVEIPWQQARYLLAEEKSVLLVTADGSCFDLSKTLIYWEELLAEKAIRIHRNALVMQHALSALVKMSPEEDSTVTWGAEILDLDEILPVSRRQLAAIRKELLKKN